MRRLLLTAALLFVAACGGRELGDPTNYWPAPVELVDTKEHPSGAIWSAEPCAAADTWTLTASARRLRGPSAAAITLLAYDQNLRAIATQTAAAPGDGPEQLSVELQVPAGAVVVVASMGLDGANGVALFDSISLRRDRPGGQ